METADQAQRPDGAVLVAELLELGMRLLRGGEGVPHHRSRVGLDRRLQLAQLETGQERFVAAGARNGRGLRSELGSLGEVTRLGEEVRADSLCLAPRGRLGRKQLDHTAEEPLGSSRVAAITRSLGATGEPFGRPSGELRGDVVERPELGPVAVGLLEVVADDLVQLDQVGAVLLEPEGKSLVELGSNGLRQSLVGRVADQEMAEAVRLVVDEHRLLRSYEVLPDERDQLSVDLLFLRRQRRHRTAVEDEPFDGTALEHAALGRLELVESPREQGLDRRGHHDLASALGRHGDHLLDEQGVAARRLEDPFSEVIRNPVGQRSEQLPRLLGRQRLEEHVRGVQLSAAPGHAAVEQLGPRHAEEHDRRASAQVGDVLYEIEEGGLAPVDIVEEDHERHLGRPRLEQLAERPGDLLGCA